MFSPSQLVFRQNPSLPNFINNKLPAQEIFIHLTALHAARKPYIESESCNKLKTALRKNIRSSSNVMYEIDDEVFFKRDNSPEWKCPATVFGQDSPAIFICQGSRHIKAHVCWTQPCKTSKLTNKSTDDVENFSTIGIIKEFEEPPMSDDDSINNNYIYNKLMMIQMSILNLIVLIKQIQQQKAIQSQRNLFKILQILKQILLLFLKMNKNVNALLKF